MSSCDKMTPAKHSSSTLHALQVVTGYVVIAINVDHLVYLLVDPSRSQFLFLAARLWTIQLIDSLAPTERVRFKLKRVLTRWEKSLSLLNWPVFLLSVDLKLAWRSKVLAISFPSPTIWLYLAIVSSVNWPPALLMLSGNKRLRCFAIMIHVFLYARLKKRDVIW